MLQSLSSGLQTKCQGGGRGEQVEEMKFYAQLSTKECLFVPFLLLLTMVMIRLGGRN